MVTFIDLKAQKKALGNGIEKAIEGVLDHGIYIMGPEVYTLEERLAEFSGVKHAITCSNGTDALALALRVKNVGPGDAVFVPTFTFAATVEVVAWMGAVPVFIDSLADTYNIDPKSLEQGIQTAKKAGLKPRGIIAVDLFGQPADYDDIQTIADAQHLWILADAAQSFGASYKNHKVGNIGDIATTSFFPAKPLGCYGDGGAIFTNDDTMAAIIKSLRVHGQGVDKYDNIRVGMNARLDTIQAAILLEKLKVFPKELVARQKVADRYNDGLKDLLRVPYVIDDTTSTWAQYTVRLPKKVNRDRLMASLKTMDIPTMIYYVKPLHLQTVYKHYPRAYTHLAVAEALCMDVVSLPMHPYLHESEQDRIIRVLGDVLREVEVSI